MAERPFEPDGFYHVGTRGNFGQPLFEEAELHDVYLRRYARVALKYGWTTLDWCLLWNHTHFLVRLSDRGLSAGMQELNSWFARRLNLIHEQTGKGHAFRHRFSAEHAEDEAHLLEVCRYIPLNPLRAGQCARPEEWRWGGYRANIGLEYPRPFHSPEHLLRVFGAKPGAARRRYREWVAAGMSRGDPPSRQTLGDATVIESSL